MSPRSTTFRRRPTALAAWWVLCGPIAVAAPHAWAQVTPAAAPALPPAAAPSAAPASAASAPAPAPGPATTPTAEPANKVEATLPPIRVKGVARSSMDFLRKDATTGALGDKPVLDTPFSLTVVSDEDIAARGARSVAQIFAKDPSVYTPSNSYSTDWWGTQIRGLAVRNNYVDDVPMLLYWGGDFPIEAVESVTALKGLTGFMYGFGEPGGALSYTLKRPKPVSDTSVTLGYRNPTLLQAHVDTSQRLGDAVGLRANLAAERGTAYNAAEIDRKLVSLALDARISPSLLWETTFLYEDSKNTAEPFQFYFSGYDVAGSGGVLPDVHYDYDKVNIDNSFYKTETVMASTGLRWEINPAWNLRYQLGFTRKDHQSSKSFAYLTNREGDYNGTVYAFGGRLDNLYTQATLAGKLDTGPVRHELVTGFGLQRASDRWTDFRFLTGDFTGNLHVEQPYLESRPFDYSLQPASGKVNQLYAFASDTLHFGEHWQAILGLRHTKYDSEGLGGAGYQVGATTPTLAVIFKPNARTSVYASFVEGLEPGTRVPRVAPPLNYANEDEVLEATISRQGEVGIKLAGDRAGFTAAVFQINRANQMDEIRGTDRYLTQDGRLVYRGAEFNTTFKPSTNLEVGAGVVYLDATIDRVSPANAHLQGNHPANYSKWQGVADAAYRLPSVPGLRVHGNWRYFGATYVSDENDLVVPSYHKLNLGLSYDFKLGGMASTLNANINNLLNEKHWAAGGWSAGNLGEARNLSVTLTTTF